MNPKSDIEIRFAADSDAEEIASLLFESFAEYESLYTREGFAATAITVEQVRDRLSEGPVWVAVCDNVTVGTGSVLVKGASLYVRGMAVSPNARGQGIGVRLLTRMEQYAKLNGFSRLFLSTTPFLDRAIRLYESFGFRRTSEGASDLFGTPLFTMEKSLTVERRNRD